MRRLMNAWIESTGATVIDAAGNRVKRLADLRGRAKWEGDLEALRRRAPGR